MNLVVGCRLPMATGIESPETATSEPVVVVPPLLSDDSAEPHCLFVAKYDYLSIFNGSSDG